MIKDLIQGIIVDIKGLKPHSKALKKFGITMFFVALVFVWVFWKRGVDLEISWLMLVLGTCFLIFGLVLPSFLKWVYVAWMSFALILGTIASSIILSAIYYLLFAPFGLIIRVLGKDIISQKIDRSQASYWVNRLTKADDFIVDYLKRF